MLVESMTSRRIVFLTNQAETQIQFSRTDVLDYALQIVHHLHGSVWRTSGDKISQMEEMGFVGFAMLDLTFRIVGSLQSTGLVSKGFSHAANVLVTFERLRYPIFTVAFNIFSCNYRLITKNPSVQLKYGEP